jgi:hypothetical protein
MVEKFFVARSKGFTRGKLRKGTRKSVMMIFSCAVIPYRS